MPQCSLYALALAGTACLVVLTGCTQDLPVDPTHVPATVLAVQPLCQLGCLDTDPDPTGPGVFLGSGVTDVACFNETQTDSDGDGLSDFCEKNLALAFAPELWYASNDDVGREPKWVAGPIEDGLATVRVMYLLSYYVDLGTTAPPCSYTSPCLSHYGDSEWIALDLYYHEGTHHWVLNKAHYSAHEGMNTYVRFSGQPYPAQLTYPTHPGAYPRAWVAFGKHANYASQDECQAGGYGTDSCERANTSARVAAGNNLNIGSRLAHTSAQDCWSSTDPVRMDNGVRECYWTYRRFSGWSGLTPDADPYSVHLSEMGY